MDLRRRLCIPRAQGGGVSDLVGGRDEVAIPTSPDSRIGAHYVVPEGIEGVSKNKNLATIYEARGWIGALIKAHGGSEKTADNVSFATHKLTGAQEMTYQGACR